MVLSQSYSKHSSNSFSLSRENTTGKNELHGIWHFITNPAADCLCPKFKQGFI